MNKKRNHKFLKFNLICMFCEGIVLVHEGVCVAVREGIVLVHEGVCVYL